jgi:hypothetical protein
MCGNDLRGIVPGAWFAPMFGLRQRRCQHQGQRDQQLFPSHNAGHGRDKACRLPGQSAHRDERGLEPDRGVNASL